jgi:hypothetical protein
MDSGAKALLAEVTAAIPPDWSGRPRVHDILGWLAGKAVEIGQTQGMTDERIDEMVAAILPALREIAKRTARRERLARTRATRWRGHQGE